MLESADDKTINNLTAELAKKDEVIFGLDAPLSYNNGGGDRASDKALRSRAVAAGLPSGSVMTPTMTKMAYLSIRGISVARILRYHMPDAQIAEIHPGATMALRGAPIEALKNFKKERSSRLLLLEWLQSQGLEGITDIAEPSDHYVAACAAALGAWKWALGESVWLYPADPPLHPFDFAC